MKSTYFTIHPGKNLPPQNGCRLKSIFFVKSTGFTSSRFPIQPDLSQNQPAAITLNTGSPRTLEEWDADSPYLYNIYIYIYIHTSLTIVTEIPLNWALSDRRYTGQIISHQTRGPEQRTTCERCPSLPAATDAVSTVALRGESCVDRAQWSLSPPTRLTHSLSPRMSVVFCTGSHSIALPCLSLVQKLDFCLIKKFRSHTKAASRT